MACLRKIAHALVALSCSILTVEPSLSGSCSNLDLPYGAYSTHLRAGEKGTCHASLASVQSRATVSAVFAHIQSNYTYVNTLKNALDAPEILLPLPKSAILQGFAVQGHGLEGELEIKSDALLPAKCPNGDSFSFYQAATLQGQSYRVPLTSVIAALEPGATVVLCLDYITRLEAKQRLGFGHVFGLQCSLPPAVSKVPDLSKSGQAGPGFPVSMELMLGEMGSLEVEVATPTAGATVERKCRDCPYVVQSSMLQDVALEIATPTRGQALANPHSLSPYLSLQEHKSTGQVAATLWLPPSLEQEAHLEVFVVVDASATMRGPRLSRVQQALRSFLRSLPCDTRLNIMGHDPSNPLEALFHESQELDETTFQKVDQALAEEFTSTQTSALAPSAVLAEALLEAVFEFQRPESQLRVFLITDRHPPDPKRAIQVVEGGCSQDCRFFSVGLGWSASPMFVEDTAKEPWK